MPMAEQIHSPAPRDLRFLATIRKTRTADTPRNIMLRRPITDRRGIKSLSAEGRIAWWSNDRMMPSCGKSGPSSMWGRSGT